jgi:phosphoglycolate phosphatase
VAITGILFDKDGTIIDYWRTWLPINREVALFVADQDRALADELLRLGGHDPLTDRIVPGSPLAAGDYVAIAQAFAAHPRIEATPALLAGIERIFRAGGAAHSALVSGAHDTIAELKRRGFRVGLATNDSVGGLEASLMPHGLLGMFDFTAGCDSGFGTKPEAGMAVAFCKAMGIVPAQAAMVGDAVHDLAMGRAAKFGLGVGVLSGTSDRADLEAYADLIVDSVSDLLALQEFAAP